MTKVKRYKVGYYTDEWGMSSNTPCLVPDDSGYAVKFEDYALLKKQRDDLLAAMEKMNRAYVILMESARDRICDLGGECDGIEVMERNDPCLRESRAAIASINEK